MSDEYVEVIREFIEEWDAAKRDAEELIDELRDVVAEADAEREA